jgi:hypothetical protein
MRIPAPRLPSVAASSNRLPNRRSPMIARANADLAPRPLEPRPSAGERRTHRVHLAGGKVLLGDLPRVPGGRVAEALAASTGFLSITGARCAHSGAEYGHLVLDHAFVMRIEENG